MRVVYGAQCLWWDTIDKVGRTPSGLPGCPYCRGVLFEMENEQVWWESVDLYEQDVHPDYRAKIEWLRGKCFPLHRTEKGLERLTDEYEKAHNGYNPNE